MKYVRYQDIKCAFSTHAVLVEFSTQRIPYLDFQHVIYSIQCHSSTELNKYYGLT